MIWLYENHNKGWPKRILSLRNENSSFIYLHVILNMYDIYLFIIFLEHKITYFKGFFFLPKGGQKQ